MMVYVLLALLVCLPNYSSHVLNYDSVTVCDGHIKQIQCPGEESIHVLQGFYGKWRNHDCKGPSIDPDNAPTCSESRKKTTKIARKLCHGQNSCTLAADENIHGNPCSKSRPYLYVTFFCLAPGYQLKHEKTDKNQEVVTVPSHGFVVQEKLITSDKASKKKVVEKKYPLLPPGNPTPENNGILYNGVPDDKEKRFMHDGVKNLTDASVNSNPEENMGDKKQNITPEVYNKKLTEADASPKSSLPITSKQEIKKQDAAEDENVRSSTICNGQSKLIACLPEEGIKINSAFYGKQSGHDCKGELPYRDEAPTCSALDAKTNVQNSCGGKQTCLLFADDNIYGKSLCPNVNKYLHLTYSCIQVQPEASSPAMNLTPQEDLEEDAVSRSSVAEKGNTTIKLCNGERRVLSCKSDVGMKIQSAFYGKHKGKDCRGDLGYRDDIPECNNPRSLDSVKFLCQDRKSCELASEGELFGDDVCPGVNKYLEVTYLCA